MAAPEYVPSAPTTAKHYSSPPQRAGGWSTTRPGETFGTEPSDGTRLGAQGPDQGFALTLTKDVDSHRATRSLGDGREFEIVKRFWRPNDFIADTGQRGWRFAAEETEHFFFIADGSRS